MKILFVTAQLAKGGGQQTQSFRLIKELSKENQVKLITFKVKDYSNLIEEPCSTEYLGYLSFPKSIFVLYKKLKKIGKNYDVIQLLDPYYALPSFYLTGLKNGYLRLGINPIKDLNVRDMKIYSFFYRLFFRYMLKNITLTVNSSHLEEELINLKPIFIPNGYDLNEFYVKKTKNELRKELNLPLRYDIIVYTGKIIPRKNLEILFESMRYLDKNYFLLIIGNKKEEYYGDTYYNKLISQFKDILHKVKFVDEVPMKEIKYYLKASDVMVFPSLLEGSPNSVLEAMSSGLPVICSNIPAHLSIINGKNGYIFKDLDDLIKYIKIFKNRLYDSKNYIKKNHDINNIKNRYMEIYYEKVCC